MKKQLTLALSLAMLVGVGSNALAAYDKYDDHMPSTEGWYTSTAHPHYVDAYFQSQDPTTLVGAEIYQNDHTYLGAQFENTKDLMKVFQAKGSYLFSNGFFAGAMLSYEKFDLSDEGSLEWQLWPGYRYSFDKGYVAASLDILSYKDSAEDKNKVEVEDLDIDVLYFMENAKVSGSMLIPFAEQIPFVLDLSGRMKFTPELVAGADLFLTNEEVLDISAGATWLPVEALVVDGKIGYNDELYYAASGMYTIQQFGLGLQVDNIGTSDDYSGTTPLAEGLNLTFKAKYMVTESDKAVFKFTMPTEENEPKTFTLAYEHYL